MYTENVQQGYSIDNTASPLTSKILRLVNQIVGSWQFVMAVN